MANNEHLKFNHTQKCTDISNQFSKTNLVNTIFFHTLDSQTPSASFSNVDGVLAYLKTVEVVYDWTWEVAWSYRTCLLIGYIKLP